MKQVQMTFALLCCLFLSAWADAAQTLDPVRNERLKVFYQTVRKAVLAQDNETLSFLMSYPLTISINRQRQKIQDEVEFRKRFNELNTPTFRKAFECSDFDQVKKNIYKPYFMARGLMHFDLVGKPIFESAGTGKVQKQGPVKEYLYYPKIVALNLSELTEQFVQQCGVMGHPEF